MDIRYTKYDTHVPTTTEFQAMIDKRKRQHTLVGLRFDKRMAAQEEVEAKQLKFLAEKTKAMSEYAQAVIDAIDEHSRKTTERAKAIAEKKEEQSQSQGTILKAYSKIVRQ